MLIVEFWNINIKQSTSTFQRCEHLKHLKWRCNYTKIQYYNLYIMQFFQNSGVRNLSGTSKQTKAWHTKGDCQRGSIFIWNIIVTAHLSNRYSYYYLIQTYQKPNQMYEILVWAAGSFLTSPAPWANYWSGAPPPQNSAHCTNMHTGLLTIGKSRRKLNLSRSK